MQDSRGRPIDLPVLRIALPFTAWISLAHRLSGLVLSLAAPGLVFLLDRSLADAAGFAAVRLWLDAVPARWGMVLLAWALAHHLAAGLRIVFIEMGIGIGRDAARRSALYVLGFGVAVALVAAWRMLL